MPRLPLPKLAVRLLTSSRSRLTRIELRGQIGLRLLEQRNRRVHGVVFRGERRRVGRQPRVAAPSAACATLLRLDLQALLMESSKPPGLGVLIDQRVELGGDAVGAAEEIADRRQVGRSAHCRAWSNSYRRCPCGVGRDAEVGERRPAARRCRTCTWSRMFSQLILEGLAGLRCRAADRPSAWSDRSW